MRASRKLLDHKSFLVSAKVARETWFWKACNARSRKPGLVRAKYSVQRCVKCKLALALTRAMVFVRAARASQFPQTVLTSSKRAGGSEVDFHF